MHATQAPPNGGNEYTELNERRLSLSKEPPLRCSVAVQESSGTNREQADWGRTWRSRQQPASRGSTTTGGEVA